MSNNEWNRLVGKRWRELTPKEHEPFRLMALLDKKRYEAVRTTSYTDTLSSRCALNNFVLSTLFFIRSVLRLVSQWKSESSKLLSPFLFLSAHTFDVFTTLCRQTAYNHFVHQVQHSLFCTYSA